MTAHLTMTDAEAAALLRAERTRVTGQFLAAKRELRAALATVNGWNPGWLRLPPGKKF